jgi:DNA-binding transcriptional ArsR family regulator
MAARRKDSKGRFEYSGLDRIFHEKARLGILTSLATHADGLLFGELKELCALTDGNLSRHLQALADAGLVQLWKGQKGKRPQTLCRMTAEGRRRFLDYIHELERVIGDAARAEKKKPKSTRPGEEGWAPA